MIVEARDDVPDNHVSEVLLKGYRQGERVLRPAQVKVARAAATPATGDAAETEITDTEDEGRDADV
jgi:hypothetical protein